MLIGLKKVHHKDGVREGYSTPDQIAHLENYIQIASIESQHGTWVYFDL